MKGRSSCGCGCLNRDWALPFAVLFLQTSMPLLIRHTRRQDPNAAQPAEELYQPASVTLLAELAKCVAAFGFMLGETRRQHQHQRQGGLISSTRKALWETGRRFMSAVWRLSALLLPAALYFASNLTAMHALSHLRSYIFTAVMNARIVFAALLSMLLLKKRVAGEQWRAIIIIVCAATVLCLEDAQAADGGLNVTHETVGIGIALGTAAVSAAGGVFVEKYLAEPPSPVAATLAVRPAAAAAGEEEDQTSTSSSMLWEEQGVLALFSAAFADLYILLFLPEAVRGRALLQGWTPMTLVLMLVQAVQGILVARAIQKWGIVFRLILGTISICLCVVAEAALFMEPVVFREGLSIVLVILGSSMYHSTAPVAGVVQQQQPGPPCVHCGQKGKPTGGQGLGSMEKREEGMVPDTEGGILRKIMGTRLRRLSPTPMEDRGGRRWW